MDENNKAPKTSRFTMTLPTKVFMLTRFIAHKKHMKISRYMVKAIIEENRKEVKKNDMEEQENQDIYK